MPGEDVPPLSDYHAQLRERTELKEARNPPPELLERIAHLPEAAQKQILELAWREAHTSRNSPLVTTFPPWHTRFLKGNKENQKQPGRRLIKVTLKKILMRTDAEGRTVAQMLMENAVEHAKNGDSRFLEQIIELMHGRSGAPGEDGAPSPAELVIRVRPVEANTPAPAAPIQETT